MKRRQIATFLLVLAILEALAAGAYWAATGANTGWTRNRVEVVTVDEITGLEARNWEDRFVPGIELLGVSLLGAAALVAVSLFIRKQSKKYNCTCT